MKTWMISTLLITACAQAVAMDLKSNDLKSGKQIPDQFVFDGMGCTGKNESPELHWTGAPKETKSFAVTVYDPDAPTGSGFWHWILINVPADKTSLPTGWKPADGKDGVAVTSDFGAPGYGGPCPPPGKPHHYVFTVHALKVDKLDIPDGATNAVARFYINGATLKKASFTALYKR